MNEEAWIREFQNQGALWFTDGNPAHPHVVLPSGKHSDVYFNPRKILENGPLLNLAARELLCLLKDAGLNLEEVDAIVCPPCDMQDLSWHLSGLIPSMTGRPCSRMGIERKHGSNGTRLEQSISFDWKRVLLVEDEICQDSMLELTDIALMDGKPLLFIAGLLNISSSRLVEYDVHRVALVHHPRHTWNADDCPLCAAGSKVLAPEDLVREWPEAA